MNNKLVFVSGNGNYPLNLEILRKFSELTGEKYKFEYIEYDTFPDGESNNKIPSFEVFKGNDVILMQCMNSLQLAWEALDFNFAIKHQYGAKRLVNLNSFFMGRRQDASTEERFSNHRIKKAKPEEFQRLKMLIRLLKCSGVDDLIVATPHSSSMLEYCKEFNINFHEIDPSPIFVERTKTFVSEADLCLVNAYSPDIGSIERSVRFAKIMGCPVLFSLKERALYNSTKMVELSVNDEIKNLEEFLQKEYNYEQIFYATKENVVGKILIMVDDEVSSGKTSNTAATTQKNNNAKAVFLMSTHPVLNPGWRDTLFKDNPFDKIIMTNTIRRGHEKSTNGRIVDVSISSIAASKLFQVLK